jgi:hypothetical protein
VQARQRAQIGWIVTRSTAHRGFHAHPVLAEGIYQDRFNSYKQTV